MRWLGFQMDQMLKKTSDEEKLQYSGLLKLKWTNEARLAAESVFSKEARVGINGKSLADKRDPQAEPASSLSYIGPIIKLKKLEMSPGQRD